jgi:hypothetical protein
MLRHDVSPIHRRVLQDLAHPEVPWQFEWLGNEVRSAVPEILAHAECHVGE